MPMEIDHRIADVSRQNATDPSDRMSSGSTIPDPHSVEEGGRTWQAYREGTYFLPNDALEQDRLDMQHYLYKLLLDDKLFWAPLQGQPANVLDIGTGTGIWATEFAELNPESNVIGTDLSQIQPTHAAPPNCSFVREDVEDNWTQFVMPSCSLSYSRDNQEFRSMVSEAR